MLNPDFITGPLPGAIAAAGFIIALFTHVLVPRAIAKYHQGYFAEVTVPELSALKLAQYWLIQILWVVSFFYTSRVSVAMIPVYALLAASLHAVCRVDLLFHIIPDRFQITGLISTALLAGYLITTRATPAALVLITILSGLSLPLLLMLGNYLFTKLRSIDGLGFGDVKLLAWLSLISGIYTYRLILFAAVLSLVWMLPKLVNKKLGLQAGFAFGPYIVWGFVLESWLRF
jgi:prepilin signal peptidase PulO-like enzyme (type II secretory pathway)